MFTKRAVLDCKLTLCIIFEFYRFVYMGQPGKIRMIILNNKSERLSTLTRINKYVTLFEMTFRLRRILRLAETLLTSRTRTIHVISY